MDHYLSIEPVADERYRIVVRDAQHRPLLHGTPFGGREHAPHAVEELRQALVKDWLYRVQVQRGKRACFVLRVPRGSAEYLSVDFSSCDRMERTISALRACAPTAPVLIERVASGAADAARKERTVDVPPDITQRARAAAA